MTVLYRQLRKKFYQRKPNKISQGQRWKLSLKKGNPEKRQPYIDPF